MSSGSYKKNVAGAEVKKTGEYECTDGCPPQTLKKGDKFPECHHKDARWFIRPQHSGGI